MTERQKEILAGIGFLAFGLGSMIFWYWVTGLDRNFVMGIVSGFFLGGFTFVIGQKADTANQHYELRRAVEAAKFAQERIELEALLAEEESRWAREGLTKQGRSEPRPSINDIAPTLELKRVR
jgi:hypothetical protein